VCRDRPPRHRTVGDRADIVEELVELPVRTLTVLRPRDSEALIDEEAFERDEFLPYWAELWPSGVALARAVARRDDLSGARVLELGCGLGLPSIAAALAGATVLASDWSSDAVAFATLNASRNGARIDTAVCSWAEPERLLAGAPWGLVLAADVLYEQRDADMLVELLPQLADEALLAEPGRPAAAGFLRSAADAWTIDLEPDPDLPRGGIYRLRRRTPRDG
jgi:predicted nicotinamide N-methyase